MSLDNIQLPGLLVQDLFKNSLIELDTAKPVSPVSAVEKIGFLGKNMRHIAILVNDDSNLYLQDSQLDFLMGILAACKLTIADVALVNNAKNPGISYQQLTEQLQSEKIFLFDVKPDQIGLPVSFPDYQVQRFNNQQYLSSPSLPALENDRMEKSKLWTCLKQIFSL